MITSKRLANKPESTDEGFEQAKHFLKVSTSLQNSFALPEQEHLYDCKKKTIRN